MAGLGFLIAISLYVALAIFVVWRTPKAWGKALAVAAVILLPTADAWWGRNVTLPELCKDAGLKVFKKASKQDGMMVDDALSATYKWTGQPSVRVLGYFGEEWITQDGFSFVEGRTYDGDTPRLSLVDGKVLRESKVTPKAKYVFVGWKEIPTAFGKNFGGSEMRIEDRQTGEVISQYRRYGFRGGWAERFLGGFADSGPQGVGCTSSSVNESAVLRQKTFE